MKTIGIIGGLGPESTIDYYKTIIAAFTAKYEEMMYPEMIIYSVNINELMKMIDSQDWAGLSAWLLEKIEVLHRAGSEFAVIASNTPHIVFDDIRSKSPIPLLSIVEETCSKAQEMNLKRMGLMGTQLTMAADFYKKPFVSNGISIVTPSEEEQQFIHQKLFSEIELGVFKDTTRVQLLSIAKRMMDEDGIDALILGCTELPLILTENKYGIPFLNTTAIHCDSIIKHCLQD